jgi:hypothetical protein
MMPNTAHAGQGKSAISLGKITIRGNEANHWVAKHKPYQRTVIMDEIVPYQFFRNYEN